MARDRRAADRERTRSGRKVDRGIARGLRFKLGQRLLVVLLGELGRGIDVLSGAAHGAKVRSHGRAGYVPANGAHPARLDSFMLTVLLRK